MFKAAAFLYRSPPLSGDGKSLLVMRHLHTSHVIGSNDPMLHTSMALIMVSDPDKAVLLDHGRAHQTSWDLRTAKNISLDIKKLIELSRENSS